MNRFTLAALIAVALSGCSATGGVGIGGGTGGLGLGAGLSFPVGGEKADDAQPSEIASSYGDAFADDAHRAIKNVPGAGQHSAELIVSVDREGHVTRVKRVSGDKAFCDDVADALKATNFAPPPAAMTDHEIKNIHFDIEG